jgi:hypothetical protein
VVGVEDFGGEEGWTQQCWQRLTFVVRLAAVFFASTALTRISDANVIHSRLRLRQLRLMLALQNSAHCATPPIISA